MKYTKPKLRIINVKSETVCNDGTYAIGSGCTVGTNIGIWCGIGNANNICTDGLSANYCYSGSTANFYEWSRCINGDTVT